MTITHHAPAVPRLFARLKAGLTGFHGRAALVVGVLATAAAPAFATAWTAWSVGSASTVVNGDGTVTFNSAQGTTDTWTAPGDQFGGKSFYSTDDFNGMRIRDLISISYDLLSATPAGINGLNGPYLNLVVTNGTDFSYLLLNASAAPAGQQLHVFSDASTRYRLNESSGGSFSTMQSAQCNDVSLACWGYGFDDVADWVIASGYAANAAGTAPIGGWMGAGADDGIILAQGNRGSTPITQATIGNLQLTVPEPGSLALVGLALAALGASARRRQA